MIKVRISIYKGNSGVVLTQDKYGRSLHQQGKIEVDTDILNEALDLVLKAYKGGEK